MNGNRIAVALCLMSLTTGAFALSRRPQEKESPQPAGQTLMNRTPSAVAEKGLRAVTAGQDPALTNAPPAGRPDAIPPHVVYDELFYHVTFLRKKADEIEREGKDASPLRSFYKKEAKLNDQQESLLAEIASNCRRDVEEMDKRARQIIKAFRQRVQAMHIQPGETPPPPPLELKTMQDERDAAVLRARDLLRANLGEDAFRQFDAFVQRNIKLQIKPVSVSEERRRQNQQEEAN
jgi:hypothetical protein